MRAAKLFGDEDFNRLTNQLFTQVAKLLLYSRILQHDATIIVDDHHAIERRIKKKLEILATKLTANGKPGSPQARNFRKNRQGLPPAAADYRIAKGKCHL